jgi:two-component system chemotaxis response regulator CheB/chemosensory pili system protein ChpB (putative protein-glutamate methylesterase)
MGDRQATVALLFDDASLSAHLREALVAQGARIVYESDLRSFAPAELVGSSADVVVVDLDNPGDDDLDRLYDTVEGGHPRLVFNDADASRRLEGWDRARWARHLAAKLVGEMALDPPRPEDARAIEPRVAALAGVAAPAEERLDEPLVDDLAITGTHGYPDSPMPEPAAAAFDEAPAIAEDVADELSFSTPLSVDDADGEGTDPTELAAELEAMLADAGPMLEDDLESVPSAPVELTELASLDLSGFEVVEEAPPPAPRPEEGFDASRFSLASLDDEPAGGTVAAATSVQIESRATEYVPPPVPEWDLVDHDAVVVEPVSRPEPSEFGIETISAAEYLAQDVVDDGTHGVEPGFTLELVSMEEAIAPRTDGEFAHEMFLEGAQRAVRRVIALGGAQESEASIATFLQALPERVPGVLLVTAHHDDTQAFAARLGRARVATDGSHVAHGDCLVVPRGSHVQIRRDGSVTVREDGSHSNAAGPSIDGVLSTLAGGFGSDALAIVFAGRGNDAVAGAQALYDAGGRVWVETVPPELEAGHMVAGIREERVADYAGEVRALVQKLIEEFP